MNDTTCVYLGKELARYSFGHDHPFGPERHDAFAHELSRQHLDSKVRIGKPVACGREQLQWFHTPEYVEKVISMSQIGGGYLDGGDTPAFNGVYEAAATVVGTGLHALEQIMRGPCRRAFIPIAGLHHARREAAAGFCVFNDCGVLIEAARRTYRLHTLAYVDIDAHHGDGVFYSYEDDPDLLFADLHEDGRYLYPGTGFADETGKGAAQGSKLNIPMPMGANDADFIRAWEKVEDFIRQGKPELILMQCGADSLTGDPITHMQYSEQAHAHAAQSLCRLADECCEGRILAMGGGGYHLDNLARAWCAVVRAFVEHDASKRES